MTAPGKVGIKDILRVVAKVRIAQARQQASQTEKEKPSGGQ